jgi:hypothetical protein
METYYVRYGGRELGSLRKGGFDVFPSGIIYRNSESSTATARKWPTMDEHSSSLKCGVQISNNYTHQLANCSDLAANAVETDDIDVSLNSVLGLTFKWLCASLLVGVFVSPTLFFGWLVLMASLALILHQAFFGFHPRH